MRLSGVVCPLRGGVSIVGWGHHANARSPAVGALTVVGNGTQRDEGGSLRQLTDSSLPLVPGPTPPPPLLAQGVLGGWGLEAVSSLGAETPAPGAVWGPGP